MKKTYKYRYTIEGEVTFSGVTDDAHGQTLLKTELACGTVPFQRSTLEILNESPATSVKEAS